MTKPKTITLKVAVPKNAERKTPSTKCRGCGKQVRVRPSGGDWLNAIYPIRHKNKEGEPCEWWRHEVSNKDLIEPKATQ